MVSASTLGAFGHTPLPTYFTWIMLVIAHFATRNFDLLLSLFGDDRHFSRHFRSGRRLIRDIFKKEEMRY